MTENNYKPKGIEAVKTRAERFAALNRWVTKRSGWIVSPPGAEKVTVECLPGSFLVGELRDAGHKLTSAGEGERILPNMIVEKLTRGTDGTLIPLTPGSTRALAETRVHAGITRVERYDFAW